MYIKVSFDKDDMITAGADMVAEIWSELSDSEKELFDITDDNDKDTLWRMICNYFSIEDIKKELRKEYRSSDRTGFLEPDEWIYPDII